MCSIQPGNHANDIDGNFSLRPGSECADGAPETLVCEESAEYDHQELWHTSLVPPLS